MVQWEHAWRRAVECNSSFVQGKKKSDFRSVYYTQKFLNIANGGESGNKLQTFPAGAFVLGIVAGAKYARVIKKDQYYADGADPDSTFDRLPTANPANLDMFGVQMQYTNDEIITPGGPCLASALFGPDGMDFPVRELIIDPSQGILTNISNELTFLRIDGSAVANTISVPIDVHVRYACMVPRAVG